MNNMHCRSINEKPPLTRAEFDKLVMEQLGVNYLMPYALISVDAAYNAFVKFWVEK